MTHGRYSNKVGKRFGKLVVIERMHKDVRGQLYVKCLCDCGNTKVIRSNHLGVGGAIRSCGCIHKESFKHINRSKDMTGQRFGQWSVMSRAENVNNGSAAWLCRCDCGVERVISATSLRSGMSKSCGCFQKSQEYTKKFGEDLLGRRFGRLEVINRLRREDKPGSHWVCKCDCGKVVHTSAKILKAGHRVSCGCKRVERLKSMVGPLNNLWNPSLTDAERKEQRDGAMVGHWRKAVLGVFGPACVICESTKDPRAHHIEAWKGHKDRRFDTDNGVVLCAACHKQFHSEHCRKDAGLAELMAFMEKKLGTEPRYVAA